MLAASWTPLKHYNLAWGLHCHSRFDDIDLVSRSYVSEIEIAKSVFWILAFCSLNVVWLLRTLKRSCTI